jgi:hypothetical protein
MFSVTNNLSQNLSQTCHGTKRGKKICGMENDEMALLTGLSREKSMARLAGIEPTTLGFGGQYSIH